MIANAGSGGPALQWSLASDATWLHVDAVQGELQPGERQTVTLSVDVSGLLPGTYTASLNVDAAPPPVHPRPINVLLVVGNILHVPAEYATIQEAVDAANMPDDAVLLADGVYTGVGNKDIQILRKSITVQSAGGDPTRCVIDCEGEGRGFYLYGSGSDSMRIEGLTICKGLAWGGGIYCSSAGPSIVNCIIRDNQSTGSGGGVFCMRPSLCLERCKIFNNRAATYGGGVSCNLGTVLRLDSCTIQGNVAGTYGGGIGLPDAEAQLTHCVIRGNEAGAYGGGIGGSASSDGNVSLEDCVVSTNHAVSFGGGIGFMNGPTMTLERCAINNNSSNIWGGGLCWDHAYTASLTVRDCVICGNTATKDAGGAFMRNGACEWTNCLLCANQAGLTGGGVYCSYMSHAGFTNCTFAANIAAQTGGGIKDYSGTEFVFDNCILWGDTPEEIQLSSSGSATLSYCDIQGGWPGDGANNIDLDPLFIDADGPDDLPGTADDDLRLQLTSPCIDAGDPDFVSEPGATDLDSRPRIMGCGVDIGAYEFITGAPGSGDLDGNGAIDVDDIAIFVHGLLNNSNLAACVADMNGDDRIDGRDIQRYAELILAR